MSLRAEIIELNTVNLTKSAGKLRNKYIEKCGTEELSNKRFPKYDWQRLSLVYNRLQNGDRCLEVGPGRGFLTTMLDREPKFKNVHAIDIIDFSKRLPSKTDFRIMNVTNLEYEDNHFDSVMCMEVLEHLSEADFFKGLSEIRRVCRSQLIVSVPFNEPMPSKYHAQKFTVEKILDWFPNGKFSLLLKDPVMRVPWLMIEEKLS